MYGQRQPEFDPEQFLPQLQQRWEAFRNRYLGRRFGRGPAGAALGILALALLIWLATGFYSVEPEQQAALRLFGEFRGTEGPGLHYYPPAPIGTRNVINVQETKEMELGFRTDGPPDIDEEALMITGDLNIVNIHLVVQYRIKDLENYLFNAADPGDLARPEVGRRPNARTLKDATEAALRQVVGQRGIDDALTVGKEAVQTDTARVLQDMLDFYQVGIDIQQVILQNVRPPDHVRQAFDDVVAARVDKESRINEGKAYRTDQLPRARGSAEQTVQAAQAFKEARIAEARGEAAEFESVLQEYQQSKEVTRRRLFLERMEEVLPNIGRLFVLDTEGNTLQLLPLAQDGLLGPQPETPTPTPSAGAPEQSGGGGS